MRKYTPIFQANGLDYNSPGHRPGEIAESNNQAEGLSYSKPVQNESLYTITQAFSLSIFRLIFPGAMPQAIITQAFGLKIEPIYDLEKPPNLCPAVSDSGT
jgi:hypothetical protein